MNAEHKLPEWLTFVDHTADAGIAVEAPDLARLFERAAYGMFSVITDLVAARATETSRISVEASDRVALLVRWLSDSTTATSQKLNFLKIRSPRSQRTSSRGRALRAKCSTWSATRFSSRSRR